jgi:hypothetical protein
MPASARPCGTRRWLHRGIRLCLLLVIGVVLVGLVELLRPRHAYFESRHGNLVEAKVVADAPGAATFVCEIVELRADNGLSVSLRALRPRASSAPLPLIVLLAGHRTGSNAVGLIGDPGAVAIAALDYPYHGPQKLRGFWQTATTIPEIRRALLDTPPAVSLAVDWLVAQPWVDTGRVELVGASLGTPFAAVAGALDQRFSRVWLIHGGARNREWLEGTLRRKIGQPALRRTAASVALAVAHGASFDTEYWVARIAPRPLVIVGANNDESLSRENVERLYGAAGEPKKLLWTQGGHVTRQRTEVVRQLLAIVRENM